MNLKNFADKVSNGEINKDMMVDLILNPDLREAIAGASDSLIKLIDKGTFSKDSLTKDEEKFIKDMEKTRTFKSIRKEYRSVKVQSFIYTVLRIFQEAGLINITSSLSFEEVKMDPEKEARDIFNKFKNKKNI